MLFATRKTSIISRNDTLNRKTTKKRKKKTSSSDATNTTTNDFHSENANVNSSRTSTAKLIETVASSILSFNLKKQTSVTVSVNSDDFEALTRGKVREVQIKGTDWSSKKNLTCKSLDISVGEVEVDYGKIVTTGRIEIKKPGGRGRAKLFMSFEDFRNFLKHPLTNEALNEVRMTFEDEAPKRDEASERLVLKAIFDEERNAVRTFQMQPLEDERVDVCDVSSGTSSSNSSSNSSSSSSEQAERVKRFFETLELDLMGTKLRYQNMRVLENGVALDLYVLVEKFPPPVIDF